VGAAELAGGRVGDIQPGSISLAALSVQWGARTFQKDSARSRNA
jgi:hypothetical protein